MVDVYTQIGGVCACVDAVVCMFAESPKSQDPQSGGGVGACAYVCECFREDGNSNQCLLLSYDIKIARPRHSRPLILRTRKEKSVSNKMHVKPDFHFEQKKTEVSIGLKSGPKHFFAQLSRV